MISPIFQGRSGQRRAAESCPVGEEEEVREKRTLLEAKARANEANSTASTKTFIGCAREVQKSECRKETRQRKIRPERRVRFLFIRVFGSNSKAIAKISATFEV